MFNAKLKYFNYERNELQYMDQVFNQLKTE